ncbi:hypothetical protein [Flavobacterium chilense]|uniref:Uncharacterized protein n=1 Tax=Flavobacterium chilense TaxID=946677 RepID=A0A1M7HRC1_9FLAO|nr:hypothetical protein [Flavobacterium chilense]SHM30657.1 hypothetical protein SAMN05444484_10577 [Flavobacterium chilense]
MEDNFIYFVNLDDFLVCANFANTNRISTSTVSHYIDHKELHPVYTLSIEDLKNSYVMNTYTSPRLQFLTKSNGSKKGLKLAIGLDNPIFLNENELKRIHEIADIEFEFERIRRLTNQYLPSRLVSIYLAEDNFEGRTMLKNMFIHKKDFIIVPINITTKAMFHKADSQWFDDYIQTKNPDSIKNYWNGIDFNNIPLYEYLVDGAIELRNEDDRNVILKEYEKRF